MEKLIAAYFVNPVACLPGLHDALEEANHPYAHLIRVAQGIDPYDQAAYNFMHLPADLNYMIVGSRVTYLLNPTIKIGVRFRQQIAGKPVRALSQEHWINTNVLNPFITRTIFPSEDKKIVASLPEIDFFGSHIKSNLIAWPQLPYGQWRVTEVFDPADLPSDVLWFALAGIIKNCDRLNA